MVLDFIKSNELTEQEYVPGYLESEALADCEFNEEVFNEEAYDESIIPLDDSEDSNYEDDRDYGSNYVGNSLQMLINQISKIELLTPEEELELGMIIAEGGEKALEARNRLVESNLRLVLHIAKHYIGRGVDMEDMTTMGIEGLIRAAEKYDYTMGYRFSTYATWWIKQSISRGITDEGSLVRVPVHMNDIVSKVRKATKDYFQEHGSEPSLEEIISITQLEESKVRAAMDAMYNVISMDTKLNDEGESTLQEILADEAAVDPLEFSVSDALRTGISRVLSGLEPKEAEVLKLRYGIGGVMPMTLEQIAALPAFNVSRERIRQIENKAIRKIKSSPLLMKQLIDFAS